MTQAELGKMVGGGGVTGQYVSRLESGTKAGSLSVWTRLAAALGVHIGELVDDVPPSAASPD